MSEKERFLSGFDPLSGLSLPERILTEYEPDSCLSHREGRLVWRLRRRSDGALYVLKACPADTEDLTEEFQILRRLAPLLPGSVPPPADCFREGETDYLVRSYLPGETLAQYREREGECTEAFCRKLGQALCALLEVLHSQEPPVIHRDIKPENILLLPEVGVGLIDFGIARQFKDGKDTDTRRMGTRSTAAPEQYGYAQTDQRTDLYALGVTLIWLLTGSYDRESLEQVPALSGQFRQVLEKAISFAPESRFQTAAEFSAALGGKVLKKSRLLPAAVVVCLLAAGGLLWAALGSGGTPGTAEGTPPPQESEAQVQTVFFSSSAMEAAVRQALGQPQGDITYDQLGEIQRLAAVGMNTFGEDQAFDYRASCYIGYSFQGEEPRGDITDADLALLAYMPQLNELYLCRQDIQDISPLAELPLTTLALCENDIMDMTPLAELTGLKNLYLGGNPATDYSPLAGLTRLEHLVVEGSGSTGIAAVDSLDFLNGLAPRYLGLSLTAPKDGSWEPLTRQITLETLQLWDPPVEATAAANTLTNLKTLHIGDYFAPDLTAFTGLTGLEVLGVHKGSLESLEGIQSLSRLITLSVGYTSVTDLTPLAGLERLNYVQLEDLPIADYSPLLELPALGYVVVPQAQAAAVEATCPGYTFELRTY